MGWSRRRRRPGWPHGQDLRLPVRAAGDQKRRLGEPAGEARYGGKATHGEVGREGRGLFMPGCDHDYPPATCGAEVAPMTGKTVRWEPFGCLLRQISGGGTRPRTYHKAKYSKKPEREGLQSRRCNR